MGSVRRIAALTVAITLSACVPNNQPEDLAAPAGSSGQPEAPLPETPVEAPARLPTVLGGSPLDWERNHPERAEWSGVLRAAFQAELETLGTPADMNDYCPPYARLEETERTDVWATLAVAIARRESAYKPDTVFAEPPPLNVNSVGLFQLSYEDGFDWCDLNPQTESLKNPLTNIDCAAGEMARLVARDGVIASGSKGSNARGLSRYWSVVRDGTGHHKAEIRDRVRALPFCEG